MKPDFGIFNPVFESAHGYLALLNLSAVDAAEAVEQVRICCGKVPDPVPDIRRLLEGGNWRPHLIAAVAAIVSDQNADVVKDLWTRLDRGSWVTPQIAVALFLRDPDFLINARTRLAAGCPVDVSELPAMTAPERHSAAGPAGTVHRSAKAAAVLLCLAEMIVPVPDWAEGVRASEATKSLLTQDIDASDRIAEKWLLRVKAILTEKRWTKTCALF